MYLSMITSFFLLTHATALRPGKISGIPLHKSVKTPMAKTRFTTTTHTSFVSPAIPTTKSRSCTCFSEAIEHSYSTPDRGMFMNSFDIHKYQRIDSPNSKGHPAPIIESIITEYMPNISSRLQLIVGHSHSHKDHIAGDDEMRNFSMPMVTTHVIPPCLDSVKSYYKIQSWPNTPAVLDLGGSRLLDIVLLPGHKGDSMSIYDRQTGLLLTGDSVYPGRIYIPRSLFRTFKKSHSRLRRLIKRITGRSVGC